MDSFLLEAASSKKLVFAECPAHPVTLVRAIRSECRRVVPIDWAHPGLPIQFVASLYAAAIERVSDEDLVATAGLRIKDGPVDAEWWEKRVLAAADEYSAGRADELAVKSIVLRDLADANKVMAEAAALKSEEEHREG